MIYCDARLTVWVVDFFLPVDHGELLGGNSADTSHGYIEISAAVYQRDGRNWVRCSVEDTGIGITPQDQQIIFDEFRQVDGSTTREYGGTGLGLAITKKLIARMGGRLWVESEGVVGKGSTFVFELPVVTEADARRTGGAQ